ncbi:MAG: Lrp/AsnC ligand binding domain-containing protein [Candidatus Woesearchaeota archaeon]|nr:MAG: Lrp/AsnC ligand binding domain-containing protein [Candidatus Woesearchaeota archaeon]
MELKEIDKKLLNLIQEEDMAVPRVTRIARKLGLATSTVKTKLNKFEKLGIIKGYSAVIDPEKVDRSFVAFKFAAKKFKEPTDLNEIGKKLAKIPEVEEAYFLVGEWDYVVKMRLKDKLEYVTVAPKVAVSVDGCKGVIAPKCFKDSKKILIK